MDKITRLQVLFATEQTLRLLQEQETDSKELKKAYSDVILHVKEVQRKYKSQ